MKALAVVLALVLGIGCLVAANWLGSQPLSPENPAPVADAGKAPAPALPPEPDAPKIAAEGPYPKAVTTETEFDFGTRLHNSKGQHEFLIRNEGDAPLELVALQKDRTCQCTGATLASNEPVPPGGEVIVELTWQIKQDNPMFRHSAKIRTNDPNNQVIELVIKGKTEKGFQFDPIGGGWDLGNVSQEATVSSTKAMYSRAQDSFEIRQAVCSNPRVKCTWEPLDAQALANFQAKSGYMLHLTVDLADFTGILNENLDISTSDNREEDVVLNVRARRKGPVEIITRSWNPETGRLYLGEFPAGEGKRIDASVYVRVEDEVKLLSAESEHEAVKISWELDTKTQTQSNVRRYRLSIEVPPGAPAQRQRDHAEKVLLKFDHSDIGVLEILVDYLAI